MFVRSLAATLSLALLTGAALAQAPQGFQLNAIEQAFLDQVLGQWETESGKIETFNCDFTQFVYDPVFGPGKDQAGQPIAKSEGYGAVSYQKPDKGSFHVKELLTWDAAQKKRVANSNLIGEHWVCDGASVYEFRSKEKQLVVTPIPPEMQGQNIADGPLPFLFGAKADMLKERYWLRVDPRAPEGSVWLAAMPKRQQDAANYRLVELMLDSTKMLPSAMRVTAPDSSQTTYTFKLSDASINNRMAAFWNTLFQAPRTPIGWTRVVEQPQMAAQPAQAQGPAPIERR